jgi:PAS domain S-box-containing protein
VAWYRAAAAAFSLLFAALTWVLVAAQAARAREAEERTRRAGDERFARLYQLVPEGVLLTRLSDDAILEVNDHFVAIVGYTRDEIVGSTSLGLRLWVDPPDRQRVRTLLESEGVVTNRLVRFRRKDGSEGDAHLSFRLFDLQGEPCVLSIVSDVTEARELQHKLDQAQKLEAIGTLAGGIAHDFNNIIGVISNFAELAKDALPQSSPAREDLEQISEASRRAARLVRQLLAFSRKQVVQPGPVDLNRLVSDTSELLRRVLPSNIAVAAAAESQPAYVVADRGQLEQVLLNLALNARDAMPDGGKLTLATTRTANEVALAVSDEGVGIPAALRSKIFEPFFTTKAPGKGTGLGLATCYGIVKQAGGRLEVQSEPGAGSTFRAIFPRLADDAVPEPRPEGRVELPSGGTETLLFAEDNAQLREATARMLSSLGYRVLPASGGKEALERARRHDGPIDLLVTDVMMPELDGRELSARLEGEVSGLRTLFLSGYADAKGIEAAIREGKAFLGKPFTLGQLATAVRAALGGR